MMKARSREQWLKLAVVLCVGCLVADQLILTPLATKWQKDSEEITRLSTENERMEQLLIFQQRYQNQLKAIKKRSFTGNASKSEGELIEALTQWAETCGVKIQSARPSHVVNEDKKLLLCRLSATGSMQAIVGFLHQLESADWPVVLNRCDLNSSGADGQTLRLELEIEAILS